MLFNFRQILFPAEGTGLKICPIFVLKKPGERSEPTLLVGPLSGDSVLTGQVHETHCLLLFPPSGTEQWGARQSRQQRGSQLGDTETVQQPAAFCITQSKSFRAGVKMKKWKARVGWDTAQGHLASLRGKPGRTRLGVFDLQPYCVPGTEDGGGHGAGTRQSSIELTFGGREQKRQLLGKWYDNFWCWWGWSNKTGGRERWQVGQGGAVPDKCLTLFLKVSWVNFSLTGKLGEEYKEPFVSFTQIPHTFTLYPICFIILSFFLPPPRPTLPHVQAHPHPLRHMYFFFPRILWE